MKEAEIKEIREKNRISQIRNSEEYNKHYHQILFYLAWLFCPPLIFGIICEGALGIVISIFIFSYTFIPLIIIAAFATWIYCSCHASKHNVLMDDKEKAAIICYTAEACILHHRDVKKINKKHSH